MKKAQPRTKDTQARRGWKRVTALLVMTGLLALTVYNSGGMLILSSAEGETAMPLRRGRVVMYAMDAPNITFREDSAVYVDQINYSFALIKDGEADASHWTGIRTLKSFMRKHPHLDYVFSVGGWGADGFSDACATEEGRRKLADSLLAILDAHGFNGIDVDWEYPGSSAAGIKSRPEDVENWYALLGLLRAGLDERAEKTGRKHLLSVAIGGGDSQAGAFDGARLEEVLDQAVIMAYDLSGFDRTTGHHAGLYPDLNRSDSGAKAVSLLTKTGLSPEKVLLGFPSYGRVWRQVSGGGNGLGQRAGTSGNKSISFPDLLALEKEGYTRYYDEAAEAAWWFNGSSFVSGEDERSIRSKCAWLLKEGLQGAAVWSYNHDVDGTMAAWLSEALQ